MNRSPNRRPTHPGELLREDTIPASGKSNTQIARVLGISSRHLQDILAEKKPVSADVAVRLAGPSEMVLPFGLECRPPTMDGTPNRWWTCRESRPSGLPSYLQQQCRLMGWGALSDPPLKQSRQPPRQYSLVAIDLECRECRERAHFSGCCAL